MKRLIAVLLLTLVAFSFCDVRALTISPQLREKLIREGAWEAFSKQFLQWQKQLEEATRDDALYKPSATLDANGFSTRKVVVILVDFSDNPASAGSNTTDTASFRDLLFSTNTTSPRSLTDFYLENSYGKMTVEGGVFGWYRMPRPYSDYVGANYGMQGTSPNAQTLVTDALNAANPDINFADFQSLYLSFGVDAVFIVHAGKGAEEGGDVHAIWSHRSSLPGGYTYDGMTIRAYLVGPEEEFGHQTFVGVYCHEFGHILGLPDLYDVNDSKLAGVGYWSLMASGSWNGNGQWPGHLDAWCKNQMSFGKCISVFIDEPNLVNVTLGSSVNDTLRYRVFATGDYKEYFLVENRQKIGFDRDLPGSGLLILHCDDNLSGSNNISQGHWHVAAEQADGLGDLEVGRNDGDANDVFPGPTNQHTEFTNLTNPSTASYYGVANQASVWNITQNTTAKTVTFNLDATFSRANLQLISKSFNDSAYGNNDGVLMPGEKVRLYYTIKNQWKAVTGVTVKVTTPTLGITLSSNQTSFGNLAVGQIKSDSIAPVEFTLAPGMQPANARFDLQIITTTPPDTFLTTFYKYIGGVEILLVDDDGGDPIGGNPMDREYYYKSALDSLNIPYHYWDATHTTLPDTSMYSYYYVIWFTGDNRPDAINPARVTLLRNYLNRGGRLLLTGQNIAEQLSASADSTFLRDYLKAGFVGNCSAQKISGTPYDPIGMGDSLWVSTFDGASNQTSADILEVLPGANRPFNYELACTGPAATAFASPAGYRVVFCGFGLEAVVNTKTGFAKRWTVIQRILDFLSSGQTTDVEDDFSELPLPSAFELNQNFPNPFNPATMIRYEISPKANGQPFELDVYNIIGQKVTTLASGIARTGSYTAEFDATARPSGVYLYRLTVGTETITKKMVLTK